MSSYVPVKGIEYKLEMKVSILFLIQKKFQGYYWLAVNHVTKDFFSRTWGRIGRKGHILTATGNFTKKPLTGRVVCSSWIISLCGHYLGCHATLTPSKWGVVLCDNPNNSCEGHKVGQKHSAFWMKSRKSTEIVSDSNGPFRVMRCHRWS